jgi:hypothetical protein
MDDDRTIARMASKMRKRRAAFTKALQRAVVRTALARDRVQRAERAELSLLIQLADVGLDAFEELDRIRREKNISG